MLSRLSSSLPSQTTFLVKPAASTIQRTPLCIRLNSTEGPAPSAGTQQKKRGVPLAQSLGDIFIRSRNNNVPAQKRNGPRPGSWNRGQGRQQQDVVPNQSQNIASRTASEANVGPRSEGNRQKGARYLIQPRQAQSAPPPRKFERREAALLEEQEEPAVIPTAAQVQVELGDLDALFGPPALQSSTQTPVNALSSFSHVTPSQERAQLLLEKTAGDYSRYAPRHYATTDVSELGPVELGGLVMSKRNDVGLKSRENMLVVVQKLTGGSRAQVSPT